MMRQNPAGKISDKPDPEPKNDPGKNGNTETGTDHADEKNPGNESGLPESPNTETGVPIIQLDQHQDIEAKLEVPLPEMIPPPPVLEVVCLAPEGPGVISLDSVVVDSGPKVLDEDQVQVVDPAHPVNIQRPVSPKVALEANDQKGDIPVTHGEGEGDSNPRPVPPNPLRQNEPVVIDPDSMDRIDGIYVAGMTRLRSIERRQLASQTFTEPVEAYFPNDSCPEQDFKQPYKNGRAASFDQADNVKYPADKNSIEAAASSPVTSPKPPPPPPPPPTASSLREKLKARSKIREPIISRSFDDFPNRDGDDDDELQKKMFDSLFKARSRKPIYASTPTLVHFRHSRCFDESLDPTLTPAPEDYRVEQVDEEEREKVP